MASQAKHGISKQLGITSVESKPGGVGSYTSNHTKKLPVTSIIECTRVYQIIHTAPVIPARPSGLNFPLWACTVDVGSGLTLGFQRSHRHPTPRVTINISRQYSLHHLICSFSVIRSFINSFKQNLKFNLRTRQRHTV